MSKTEEEEEEEEGTEGQCHTKPYESVKRGRDPENFMSYLCLKCNILHLWHSESHGEEEEEDAEDDDEDDEGDEAEEAGEENDRPYNLRQRKTVQRYEAPPIGITFLESDFMYIV